MTIGRLPSRAVSAIYLTITALAFPAIVWGMLGTWQSARKYRERGGSTRWATAATIVTALLLADMVSNLVSTVPILVDNVRMVFTGRYGPPATIRVIDGGVRLLVQGQLQSGSAAVFLKAIDADSRIKTIDLDSSGGLVTEASNIADAITVRHLNTTIAHECSSACTLVFLAGSTRCLSSNARMGFHSWRLGATLPDIVPSQLSAQQRALYLEAGLPESLVDRIMATPSTKMWYPTHSELAEAHVVTPDCDT